MGQEKPNILFLAVVYKVVAIPVKKHLRLAKSIFRAGLDILCDSLLKPIDSLRLICQNFIKFVDLNEACCN